MDWIITVKQEYLWDIVSGAKRVEFRTRLPKLLKRGDRVFCVRKQSKGRVALYFYVEGVVACGVGEMWERYNDCGGILQKDFYRYFEGRGIAYAIRIAHKMLMDNDLSVREFGLSKPPQWFAKPRAMPAGL